MTAQELAQPRVVRTAHDENGNSIFVQDSILPSFYPIGPQGSGFTTFDSRDSVPVNNNTVPTEFPQTIPRTPSNGVIFCLTDIKPGGRSPMHRTQSLDYAVVLTGEIVISLAGGDEKTVKAGEFIVQQGADHAWINKSNETCRMAFVMVGSEKIRTEEGVEFDETLIKAEIKAGVH
ncbi:hypothetical protein Golomagni_06819 [Golovinomyces magnicellulatus]|nr:hypothetical protein Golomagni_06819 [Golovinomyces magnicellulatus]